MRTVRKEDSTERNPIEYKTVPATFKEVKECERLVLDGRAYQKTLLCLFLISKVIFKAVICVPQFPLMLQYISQMQIKTNLGVSELWQQKLCGYLISCGAVPGSSCQNRVLPGFLFVMSYKKHTVIKVLEITYDVHLK